MGVLIPGAGVRRDGAGPPRRDRYSDAQAHAPLVTTGLYRFSRNPIDLGMTLAYLGVTLLADSLLAPVLLSLVLIFVRFGVIEREERYLERKFGQA